MIFKRLAKFSVVVFLLTGLASYSFAAFKTNRIGNTKGLASTPVADLITALNSKLSDFDNSTLASILSDSSSWLTNEDIKDLNLDLSSFGGYPLDQHELAFLTHSLASAVNDGSLTLGTSQASLQDAIDDDVVSSLCSDSDCAETSADWVHGQVSDDNFTNNVSLLTASLIDDLISSDSDFVAGYTSLVLGANSDVGISDLQTDPFFQAIVNPSGNTIPSTSEVMNAINLLADFVVPETPGSPTSSEYSAGQSAVNAFLDNSDTNSFTVADFLECYNNSETDRSGGANTCNISASQWETNSSELTYFAEAKEDIDDNITLTAAQLTNIGLDLSGLGDPVPSLALDYLSDTLDSSATLTSAWQTTINAYDVSTASLWKVAQIAAGDSDHPTSDLTVALLESAGMTDNATTTTGVSLSNLQSSITTSSLTTASSGSDIDAWVIGVAGFSTTTSLSDITTATDNGWDKYLYADASKLTGWTNSESDWDDFYECYSSSDANTGGDSDCSLSSSGWDAINAAITAISDNSSTISGSNIDTILSSTETTAHDYFDSSNSVMVDYVNQCISGATNGTTAVTNCVTSGTNADFKKKIKAFQIGKIVATNSGSYSSSSITANLLGQVGVPSNSKSVISSNNCGTSGTSSCLSKLKTALLSSDLTAASTPAEVTAKVNELMLAEMKVVANNTSIPTPTTTPVSGCSTSYNMPLPDPCGHSQWTCTKQSGPSSWTISGTNLVVPDNNTSTGTQSVTIRMALGIYTPAYTKDVTRSYDVDEAVSGASNGYKKYSTSSNSPWTAWNKCTNLGGDLASKPNVDDQDFSLDSHMWFAPTTNQSPNTLGSGSNYKPWVSSSQITCRKSGSNGQAERGGYGNHWLHCGSQSSYVKSYWCKNLPSC